MRVLLLLSLILALTSAFASSSLEDDWNNPPPSAHLKAYWWWLNGNVTKESITRDLESMKEKGFGGAVIIDAGGASQMGNSPVPHGPTFFSQSWRELYKHALHEANRLGLEMSLNIQSGWNLGGPMVTAEDAAKKYVWSEADFGGGKHIDVQLPLPSEREHFYRDSFVVGYRIKSSPRGKPLKNWKIKALQTSLQPFSAPDTAPLFAEIAGFPGEEDVRAAEVVNLSSNLGPDGVLHWDAPDGQWQILRFGYTIGDHAYVSTASDGGSGFALDVYDQGAFERYWKAVVEPLLMDAGPLAGTTLKYLHTDSWEIELANWTPGLSAEFQKRRGYDMAPWLPVLAGRIVDGRNQSDRFLADYRKTLGDLAIDHHYRLFRDNAHARGLGIHPESGGPHAVPIDAQRCLGWDDAPMSEFWAWSWTHRIGDENRFFVKQPASAAHTYGHQLVYAEGFTDIGPHWQESIWANLKPSFDKAVCEGLNLLVWHAFVCSPDDTGIPGQQYFAGTHLNPKVTWWGKSQAFFQYINRCQSFMQRGLPFADVLYYYGDHVPNFAQLKKSDPAHILPGYDYDVITEEALLGRATAKDGQIYLPDGMSYRMLVLPPWSSISIPVLRKVKELMAGGATVVGPKPGQSSGLTDYPSSDKILQSLANELFGQNGIITNQSPRQVLEARGIEPDCLWEVADKGSSSPEVDFIHRTDGTAQIYFVANRSSNAVDLRCSFRIRGLAPEIWDPVNGQHRFATDYSSPDGRTALDLHFDPCGSILVAFREPASAHPSLGQRNWPEFESTDELSGPWIVQFDPPWGGPMSARFDHLESWSARPEEGIKYYSGTATYRNHFLVPSMTRHHIILELGDVHEVAEVKVNGQSCGITWSPPFAVDITSAVKPDNNFLEIDVVNFWPNRIIGDQSHPPEKRLTKTNIRALTEKTPLMISGLLGPVRVLTEK